MNLRDKFRKVAAEKGLLETNEDQSTTGVNALSEPVSREEDMWGDPGPKDPQVNTEEVKQEAKKTQEGNLRSSLSVFDDAAKEDKKLLRENFDHTGEREPHSPLLKGAHYQPENTLTEKVRKVIG
jgi:hypothetical protein